MSSKKHFATTDLALIGIFSALWITLNLTVAPLGFRLTGLPVIHDIIAFLTLLLVAWATGKLGAASFVGLIGSLIVLLAGGPLPVLGFAASSVLFDAILMANHHKLNTKPFSMTVAALATFIAAYLAGIINGIFIIKLPLAFTLTVWGGWNLIGGMLGAAITLPTIIALEKAHVKKVKTA